jgi:hypothetical protein
MRYSRTGLWGKGTYFAVNGKYSDGYAYKENNLKQMFLAEVILGKYDSFKQFSLIIVLFIN